MNREVHVRFCERFGGVTPPYLLDYFFVMVASHLFLIVSCRSICHLAGSFAAVGLQVALCEQQMYLTALGRIMMIKLCFVEIFFDF